VRCGRYRIAGIVVIPYGSLEMKNIYPRQARRVQQTV
jgi:hypothetical protein